MKRGIVIALVMAGCLAATRLPAQTPAGSEAQKPTAAQQQPGSGSSGSANPFPEDTSTVPVMPAKGVPALPEGTYSGGESAGIPLPGDDSDPVRSPDDAAPAPSGAETEGSSSLSGLERLLPQPESDQPEKKKKPAAKEPTRQEAGSKDIEIGEYYLETKNWKAALSRFESALVLDPENPEVYWGLAEAERRLGEFAKARGHYTTLLDYDPDGPHGKEARKALKDPALAAGAPK
jgi:tetratricopeptide (TPR) repeat protein